MAKKKKNQNSTKSKGSNKPKGSKKLRPRKASASEREVAASVPPSNDESKAPADDAVESTESGSSSSAKAKKRAKKVAAKSNTKAASKSKTQRVGTKSQGSAEPKADAEATSGADAGASEAPTQPKKIRKRSSGKARQPAASPKGSSPPVSEAGAAKPEPSFVDSPFADTGETIDGAEVEPEQGADLSAEEGGADTGPAEPELSEEQENRRFLKGLLEALLFASDKPLTLRELARAAKLDRPRTRELLSEVIEDHAHGGIVLIEIAGGFTFRSHPSYANYVQKMLAMRPVRLSRAQLETLAVIAYRQPTTRPEVDDIRGVDTGQVIKGLMERDLIRILGKKDEPGRPMLYGTTDAFLELFSLESLRELPSLREFTELNEVSRATFEQEIGETAPEGPVESDVTGEDDSEATPGQPTETGTSEGQSEDADPPDAHSPIAAGSGESDVANGAGTSDSLPGLDTTDSVEEPGSDSDANGESEETMTGDAAPGSSPDGLASDELGSQPESALPAEADEQTDDSL